MTAKIRVCLAGATGWTGRALVSAIRDSDAFQVTSAVARRSAGLDLGLAIGGTALGVAVSATIQEALKAETDVLIDYSHPTVVKDHVLTALRNRVPAVIGTSGLSPSDFQEIQKAAETQGLGVIASGNFSITAALAKHFTSSPPVISPIGKSWTTPRRISRTFPAAPPRNWRKVLPACGRTK
jgi:4-hydroxy-tetrahydrodipicolinate reductase